MDLLTIGFIFFVITSFLIFILIAKESPEESKLSQSKTIHELRSRQISGLRGHAVKRKFEESLTKRSKPSTKLNIEAMLLQAGFKHMTFGEYVLLRLGIMIIAGVTITLTTFDPLFVLVGVVLSFFVPGAIVGYASNKRAGEMEEACGSFIELVTERYNVHGDFQRAIKQTEEDFRGQEPIHSEITQTVLDLNIGMPTEDALEAMGDRTGNRFIYMFAKNYRIGSKIGTAESRDKVIGQTYRNYYEDYEMKQNLKSEIKGPKTDTYIMLLAVPIFMGYQIVVNEEYIDIMTNTLIGRIGLIFIISICFGVFIFTNKVIGAPLDKKEKKKKKGDE